MRPQEFSYRIFQVAKQLMLGRYLLFLLGLHLYLVFTNHWIERTNDVFRMEVPFLLYLYVCFNFLIKKSKWQAVVAAVPLALLYLIHDYYFLRFFRIPKLNDFYQLPELLAVLDWGSNLALLVLTGLLGWLLIAFVRFSRLSLLLFAPVLILVGMVFLHPASYVNLFSWLAKEVIYYAAVVNVERNGRVVTALYNEAKRRQTLADIANYRDIDKLSLKLPATLETPGFANGKNVHLIVLEGFIDPTLLGNLPNKVNPAHPDFTKLVETGQSFSISPVFGGYTAQAEFEMLCGVPAFQEFDEIEFNVFTGSPTYCLPSILQRFGYQTKASNGFKPDFFNTMPAYRGIGFDSAYFAKEYTPTMETYLSKGEEHDNKYFFDGDMYEQNLGLVKRLLAEKRPFFNYVLTVYGHLPFHYGSRVGPPLFKLPNIDPELERIINQHYYRTLALAKYMHQLMALDPEALIVLISDHLPPLQGGFDAYDALGYLSKDLSDRFYRNRLLVFRGGKLEKQDLFYHFNIYRLILDFVSNQGYCRTKPCDFRYPLNKEAFRDDYHILMGLASQPVP